MKKIALTFAVCATIAFAGSQNVATLDDLKEAIYKLIVKYEELSKQERASKRDIAKLYELKKSIDAKIDNFIKRQNEKIKKLESRAVILSSEGEDKYDRYIKKYIENNKEILENIK